ncbi:MAG: large conductance mechanosensitive channel protein MscL [Gemmatimonadaceae bacterium]
MLGEFRKFIERGNVLDLAVGIVIGAAFVSVVNSFVNDVLMPPIGHLTGGVDFTDLFINLSGGSYVTLEEAKAAGAATINYGLFIGSLISFIIVAFSVFLIVRSFNRVRTIEESAPPAPSEKECQFCRMRIPLDATKCGHCTSNVA